MTDYISEQIQREVPNFDQLEPHQQYQVRQNYKRQAATFGYRKIDPVHPENANNEQQQLRSLAPHQNRDEPKPEPNFEVVRSDDTRILRRGLLPHAHLPASRQTGGQSKWNIRYVGRLFHRGLAWMASRFHSGVRSQQFDDPRLKSLVEQRNPPQTNFGRLGNTNMVNRPENRVVQASDHDLARMLGYGAGGPGHKKGLNNKFAGAWAIDSSVASADNYVGGGKRRAQSPPLFESGPPRRSDIHQSHNRGNCPFLSTLASIMSRPDGAARIQSMMKDNGDGTVTVRFDDRDIRVTKDRIVDRGGKDLFSVGNAPWVRVMEKAYLGYLASKYGDQQKVLAAGRNNENVDYNAPPTNPKDVDHNDFRKTSSWSPQQKDKDRVNQDYRYDYGDTGTVHMAMRHVLVTNRDQNAWENEDHGWAGQENGEPPVGSEDISGAYSTNDRYLGANPEIIKTQVDDALDKGGTVNATADVRAINLVRTVGQRVPPQHFVAIVGKGTQTVVRNGQAEVKKGYWVQETFQFGDNEQDSGSAGSNVSRDDGSSRPETTNTICGRDSLYFVTEDDLMKKFTNFQVYAPKWKDPEPQNAEEFQELSPGPQIDGGSNQSVNKIEEEE